MPSSRKLNWCPVVFVDGERCNRPVHTQGVCSLHFARKKAGRDLTALASAWTKPVVPCEAAGCEHPAYARGLCSAHYQRKIQGRATGRPVWRKGATLAERLPDWLAETTRQGDCLLYPYTNASGYATGVHDDEGRNIARHRAVYKAVHGDIPKWAHIHHACANRACINPEHLVLASQKENTAEMHERTEYVRRIAFLEAALASHHCPGCCCPK